MFEYLEGFKYIFVSGMQRTGTTICMRMIQYDIEAPQCIWLGSNTDRLLSFEDFPIPLSYPLVLHSPGISHLLHTIQTDEGEKSVVVWMKRDPEEILDSVRRGFNWDPQVDLKKYGINPTGDRLEDTKILMGVKEEVWEKQKENIEYWFEVKYEDLKNHRLWISSEEREKFTQNSRHTSPGLSKIIPDEVFAWEGGELEHLLKEFPKGKIEEEELDWSPPWKK